MTLHDPEFNHRWIRALTTTTTTVGHGQLDAIRTQVCIFLHLNAYGFLFNFFLALKFGEAVALYFAFLSTPTHVPSSLSPSLASRTITSVKLTRFSILPYFSCGPSSFVEYWRVRERIHSATWGCLGSVRVEHHRPRYVEGHPWWKRELKVLVSVPVIVLFASVLAVLLTAIFVLEAFVTALYTGPGHRYIVSASPQAFVAESLKPAALLSSPLPQRLYSP
jgi:anoctamin-10